MRRLRAALPVLTAVIAAWGLTMVSAGTPAMLAQDAPLLMKVDLIVPASGYVDGQVQPEGICVMLPDEASTVAVSRRAFVPEAGTDRQLTMTIRPFISTAYPLIENANIRESLSLTIPELGRETCFSFENAVTPLQVRGIAQPYKAFAQIVTIEVR